MTPPEARRIVIGSMVAGGALAAAGQVTHGDAPRIRIFVGALAAGVVLSMLSEVAPDLAGMFALLALSTAVFTAGVPTFNALRRAVER